LEECHCWTKVSRFGREPVKPCARKRGEELCQSVTFRVSAQRGVVARLLRRTILTRRVFGLALMCFNHTLYLPNLNQPHVALTVTGGKWQQHKAGSVAERLPGTLPTKSAALQGQAVLWLASPNNADFSLCHRRHHKTTTIDNDSYGKPLPADVYQQRTLNACTLALLSY
jgi:hypothetical protein